MLYFFARFYEYPREIVYLMVKKERFLNLAENEQLAVTEVMEEEKAEEQVVDNASDLYEEIRKYRYNKAKEELLKIQGFGQVKVDKYGDDLLNIINM